MVDIYVPDVEVEQEHNWNGVGCCSEKSFMQCSSVPVARATPLRHLFGSMGRLR